MKNSLVLPRGFYLLKRYVQEQMMTQQRHNDIKFWFLSGLTLLISGIMTLLNLEEFVTIGLLKHTTNYPFGGEGYVPWYYETADLYAKVNLAFALGFLTAFIAGIWSTIKGNKTALFIAFLSTIFLILMMYVNGQAK